MEWCVDGPVRPLQATDDMVTVLHVRGEVDLESGATLREEAGLALCRACEPFPLCIDLREVKFIDCAGLRFLHELVDDLTERNHTVVDIRHSRAVDFLVSALDQAGVGAPRWSTSGSSTQSGPLVTSKR